MDNYLETLGEMEKRQEAQFRKENNMKMQIKQQESVLADAMLHNRHNIISNMWQFDDTKRRIYQMDNDPQRKAFLDRYFAFIETQGKPLRKLPVLARYPLDLFKLYLSVNARGGFEKCTRSRQWSYVAIDLKLPTTITSAAYSLRTQYNKLLRDFENHESSLREKFASVEITEQGSNDQKDEYFVGGKFNQQFSNKQVNGEFLDTQIKRQLSSNDGQVARIQLNKEIPNHQTNGHASNMKFIDLSNIGVKDQNNSYQEISASHQLPEKESFKQLSERHQAVPMKNLKLISESSYRQSYKSNFSLQILHISEYGLFVQGEINGSKFKGVLPEIPSYRMYETIKSN